MFGLMSQFRHPEGLRGRLIAALMNRNHKSLTTWGLSHIVIDPDYLILDVGCGGGKTINRMAKQVVQGKVFGVDHSVDMVKYSKKVNKKLIAENRVEILESSVQNMIFLDNSFDLVTAIETYYFWNKLPVALSEIRRVLKPGGRLLVVNEMIKDGVYELERSDIIEKTGVKLLPLEEIRAIMLTVGFVNVEVITKAGSPWNVFLAQK